LSLHSHQAPGFRNEWTRSSRKHDLHHSLYRVIAQVEELRLDHNELLRVEGVVVNQFTGRTGLHQNLVDELLAEGLPVLPVYLSSSVKMRESHEVSVPIIHLAPRHRLSREFFGLLDALERAA
jgi:chromosome partitioning protein